MKEETSFWRSYGLMILAILLYGIDLAAVVFVSQKLYKNIVEVTFIISLPPTYFVIWLLRGKERREKERKEGLSSRWIRWGVPTFFLAMALYTGIAIPYSLEWGYCLAYALGEIAYQTCLKKRIPGWGQRLSELYLSILFIVLFMILSFPLITGLKTVNQAEAILSRQGYEDIRYAANTHSYGVELIFEKEAPTLTNWEKKTEFYVFSAMNQGQEIGVIVSPASGRIIGLAELSENLVLERMIHQ